MTIETRCPTCQSVLAAGSETCPQCGEPSVIPATLDIDSRGTQVKQASPDPFPELPAEFGRYRVLRLLGRGGMGAVYLAHDTELGRSVAIKLPTFSGDDSAARRDRFIREGRSAARLSHPNLCTIYDAGRIDGRAYISMAYIKGQTLSERLHQGRVPVTDAVTIVHKIAEAVQEAHERGIVHRDLKPANVMLTPKGEPIVMDFGLAKQVDGTGGTELVAWNEGATEVQDASATRVGAVIGTPAYMSPEQVRGETDSIGPASDIYSLGVILFELITGRPPYRGAMAKVFGQILTAPVPSLTEYRTDADPRLDVICRRALAKEPSDRFASMSEFASALSLYLNTVPEPFADLTDETLAIEEPKSTRSPAKKSRPRQRGALLGALAVLVLLIAVGAWSLFNRGRYGQVAIKVNGPASAQVTIDGEKIDPFTSGQPIRLRTGDHEVTVSAESHDPATKVVTVRANSSDTITIDLKAVGEVVVKLSDPGAKVTVQVGPTRLEKSSADYRSKVPVGTHTLKVEGKGYEPVSQPVVVKTGATVVIDVVVKKQVKTDEQLFAEWTKTKSLSISYEVKDRPGVMRELLPSTPIPNDIGPIKSVRVGPMGNSLAVDDDLELIGKIKSINDIYLPAVGLQKRLSAAGIKHLSELTEMVSLQLDGAVINDDDLKHLSGMTKLTHFWIGDTRVTGTGLRHMSRKIEHLIVNGAVTDDGAEEISKLRWLNELHAVGPKLGTRGVEHLAKCAEIHTISLGKGNASDESLANAVTAWKKLQKLYLIETNVGERAIKAMAGKTKLTFIDLTGSQLGPRSFEALKQLRNAEHLQLVNTNLTKEQIDEVRSDLPNCKVVDKP